MSLSYARYYSLEPGDTWFNSPSTQSGWRLLRRVDATAVSSIFTINPSTVLSLALRLQPIPEFRLQQLPGL